MPEHQIQVHLTHPPSRVFAALTDAEEITKWFAEHAEVSLVESRFDFWGRYTPTSLTRADGSHPILSATPNEAIDFAWPMGETHSTVMIRLLPRKGGTLFVVRHTDIPKDYSYWMEDVWFLGLENLRRYLDGRNVVRYDFTQEKYGNYSHTVEINGSAAEVFKALTVPEQINRWIAKDAKVDLQVGGEYSYGWPYDGPTKILELEPNRKLSHGWAAWGDEPPSIITWELEESGGRTRLTLTHSGFAPDHPPSGEQVGWLNFMNWLKSLIEYGANWLPPTTRLSENMETYYASSIIAAQGEIVTTISVRKENKK